MKKMENQEAGVESMNKKAIFSAVALGVGVGAFVLNLLGILEEKEAISLLAIGVICLAITRF